jgi:DNA-binding MarR family transcriptional regulator
MKKLAGSEPAPALPGDDDVPARRSAGSSAEQPRQEPDRGPAATAVRRAVIALARRLRAERAGAGLTALELSVLGHLRRRGALSPGELATAERVQPQSLTRTLTRLEAEGLAARTPDPADGRRSLLAISPAGQSALRAEMASRDNWLATVMAAELTSTETELLRLAGELLERLAEAADPPGP